MWGKIRPADIKKKSNPLVKRKARVPPAPSKNREKKGQRKQIQEKGGRKVVIIGSADQPHPFGKNRRENRAITENPPRSSSALNWGNPQRREKGEGVLTKRPQIKKREIREGVEKHPRQYGKKNAGARPGETLSFPACLKKKKKG